MILKILGSGCVLLGGFLFIYFGGKIKGDSTLVILGIILLLISFFPETACYVANF